MYYKREKGILLFVIFYLQTHEGDILMTRTKTTKLVAIIMAVFMAFAFMSFSLTYVSAEDPAPASSDTATGDNDQKSEETPKSDETPQSDVTPTPVKTAPTPVISLTTYTYGAPDIIVSIDFKDATPKLDYTKLTDSDLLKTMTESIKVYSDRELTKQVNYIGAKFSNPKFENNKLTFTVPLNKSNLSATTTYYLFLDKALNETTEVEGADSFFEFKTNATTTSTRSTTRTTYRTITTRNSTVRARSANTDDPSHLPVWIGLAAVSALMLGAVYFSKERD